MNEFNVMVRVQRPSRPINIEKSLRNLIKTNWNQTVFTIFWLTWNQTYVCLVPNQSENGKYNLIWGWFKKISLCARIIYHRWTNMKCIVAEQMCFIHDRLYNIISSTIYDHLSAHKEKSTSKSFPIKPNFD